MVKAGEEALRSLASTEALYYYQEGLKLAGHRIYGIVECMFRLSQDYRDFRSAHRWQITQICVNLWYLEAI